MSATSWIKFFPTDWLHGTRMLTPVEKGVYITLIAMMYDEQGPIPLNARRLSRECNMLPNAFSKALEVLVEMGKLTIEDNAIFNEKTGKILGDMLGRSEKARKGGLAKARKKAEENQWDNSALADTKQEPSNAQDLLEGCLPSAIPDTRSQIPEKRASKLAPKDEGEGKDDTDLEAELRHAAGWHHDAKRLSHVKPIADLIERGLSLHDDVIPTIRQLAPNVEHKTSWTYFVGPLEDILRRRTGAPEAKPTEGLLLAPAKRVWVWKGTPQWEAWAKTRAKPWPTSEQPHPEGGRRAGWWFDAEWPPPSGEQAA